MMVVDFTLQNSFQTKTIVAEPLSSDIPGNMKHSVFSKQKDILKLNITSVIILTQPLCYHEHAEFTKGKV